MEPFISVVIPAYNASKTIDRAIKSVFGQTYLNTEIIVIDDGSTDDTAQRVKSYGNKVKYIYQSNAGAGAARNLGVDASKGEWIALLDADDEWHPRKIELQLKYIQAVPDIVLVSNNPLIVRDCQDVPFPEVSKEDKNSFFIWKHSEFLRRNKMHTSSVLIKREVYQSVGGCDPSLINAQDRDLWLKVLYRGIGICVNLPLTKYHHMGGSLSRNVVRRFRCDITLIDRWDNRISNSLDIDKRIPVSFFKRNKYAVLYTMVFKLLKLGMDKDAKSFWQELRCFHGIEYPFLPILPWNYFKFICWLDGVRKKIKYG